jgi:hypothetical protein
MIFITKDNIMDKKQHKKEKVDLVNKLDEFLGEEVEEKECVGEECLINDGKEIVERVDKVYKTTDGRQLLM